MLELIRRMVPEAKSVEVQHGTGRARHLLVTGEDGVARPCVLRRAPARELVLYQSVATPAATGAPALLGWTADAGDGGPAGGQAGAPDGASAGAPDGAPAGAPDGASAGAPDGARASAPAGARAGTAPTPARPASASATEPRGVWLLLEALPEQFPDFTSPAEVAACYLHLATIHTTTIPHNSFKQPSPWAIAPTEVTNCLSAFPESGRFTHFAPLLQAGPPALIHGDYHRWNLIRHHQRTRVLDWEHAGLADPIWDLVLLTPEEPGWDGIPRGALALHALQTYHEAGPLARLSWNDFLFRQRLARLFVAARWAMTHAAKAATQPPGGPRDQILAYADAERNRVKALSALLAGA